jgi:hypothetical protein
LCLYIFRIEATGVFRINALIIAARLRSRGDNFSKPAKLPEQYGERESLNRALHYRLLIAKFGFLRREFMAFLKSFAGGFEY